MTATFQLHDGDASCATPSSAPRIASDAPLGIGVRHGWRRVGEPMLVTRSAGNRVYTLDDRPALDVYLERLDAPAEAARDPAAFTRFALTHPLGLSRRSGEEQVRFVGEADFEDRSLGCIAEVPQGGLAWFMEGDDDSVLEATDAACGDALAALDGAAAARACSPSTASPAAACSATRASRARSSGSAQRARRRAGGRLLHLRRDRPHARHQRLPQPDARRPGGRMSASPTAGPTQQLAEFLAAVSARARTSRPRCGRASNAPPRRSRRRSARSSASGDGRGVGRASPRARRPRPRLGPSVTARACPGWASCPSMHAPFDGRLDRPRARRRAVQRRRRRALLRGMAHGARPDRPRCSSSCSSLRSRQGLLERLAQIQRSIVQRTDLDSLLEAIVNGAGELVGDEVVTLRLLDDGDPRSRGSRRAASTTRRARGSSARDARRAASPTELQSARSRTRARDPCLIARGAAERR